MSDRRSPGTGVLRPSSDCRSVHREADLCTWNLPRAQRARGADRAAGRAATGHGTATPMPRDNSPASTGRSLHTPLPPPRLRGTSPDVLAERLEPCYWSSSRSDPLDLLSLCATRCFPIPETRPLARCGRTRATSGAPIGWTPTLRSSRRARRPRFTARPFRWQPQPLHPRRAHRQILPAAPGSAQSTSR